MERKTGDTFIIGERTMDSGLAMREPYTQNYSAIESSRYSDTVGHSQLKWAMSVEHRSMYSCSARIMTLASGSCHQSLLKHASSQLSLEP